MYSTTTYQLLEHFAVNILELAGFLLAIISSVGYLVYKKAEERLRQQVREIAKQEAQKMKEEAIQQLVMAFAQT